MRKLWKVLLWTNVLLGGVLLFTSAAWATSLRQSAEEGERIFQQQCAGCHTIGGGRLVGPDLQGITSKRDRDWLVAFIRDPNAMFASDPDAKALLDEYQVPMPSMGLTDEEIQAVLAYLESTAAAPQQEQGGEEATATPPPSSAAETPAPLTKGDPNWGQRLFTGEEPLENGGTACVACHSVAGIGPLGGGTMGPDLTHVFSRYGGEKGLASALATLPFPVMREIYADHPLSPEEQAHLLAFFERADAGQPATTTLTLVFTGIGVVGMVVLFGVLLIGWPRQRESLSDQLRRQA